ncbi:PD-(D/E)XK nuclease family protein [Microbulbifer sp. THAF38]|uniref:PD-(D/E)XK nuclease family protein n=1 Tax=Microbulbifer sp. THAF38 TaxID=2587856 RepID=UPI00126952E3|nr:PD-(D/E)XK nuclease family protein [Microbulbifer sp. THAF38]QFT57092.1 hypothetical protein FIU95_21305 [Microbulbifer sp. THAF38]
MIDIFLYGLLGLAAAALLYNFLQHIVSTRNSLGIEGKLIWIDKGRSTKPFFNHAFEVLGKPDLMYRIRGGILAVEYKSRRGPVFKSDVVQAKCAALAARGNGYQVTQLLVKTSTTEQYIELPGTDRALFEEIKKYVILTRQAKAGVRMKPWPNVGKCRGCAYKSSCQHVMR